MLQDLDRAERLAKQLDFFGLGAQSITSVKAFRSAMVERLPAAIVMDVDFSGANLGLELAAQAQLGLEQKLPLLFFSLHETDTPTRLAARARRRARVSDRHPRSLQPDGKNQY